ncbi:DUF2147 domain-containing protein [Pseudooceanicola sp. 216_PA32_1]|jgi:uncharacterized protein (DUF2147 family)|uniref:DUF2147 domain-containing protein n=1 Tax=Pseudooceanicola pacificus TaxID=2676438 RepID=A0A844W432_9RHOB|nr:DUF2147 domain-containing protein [Pseudooceanicola pacificus]MWB77571.1 DUF2147 domain-containing protein [Pseudooceanicola pacificus]
MRFMTAVVTALVLGAGMAAADPVEGLWKTEVDDGNYAIIDVSACGARICGVISRTFNADGEFKSEVIGRQIVWDMMPEGGGAYGDGKIWRPSNDKVYRSKMKMSGNSLKVSGCIGPICLGQNWTRVQ